LLEKKKGTGDRKRKGDSVTSSPPGMPERRKDVPDRCALAVLGREGEKRPLLEGKNEEGIIATACGKGGKAFWERRKIKKGPLLCRFMGREKGKRIFPSCLRGDERSY